MTARPGQEVRRGSCSGAAALCLAFAAAAPVHAATIVVTSTADGAADDGLCTLHEAAIAVNTDAPSGATPGECAAGSSGVDVVTFSLPPGSTIVSNALPFVFDESVEIVGPGADLLSITNAGPERVMVVDGSLDFVDPIAFTLRDVTIFGGWANAPHLGRSDSEGGGLLVLNVESVTLSGVLFRDNLAELSGGAVSIDLRPGGTTLVEDCEFRDNDVVSTVNGGGGALFLASVEDTTIRRSLFVGNLADGSGQTGMSGDPDGGALQIGVSPTGTLLVESSTFTDNTARGDGGAIAFGNEGASQPTVTATLRSLTITGNTADFDHNGTDASGGGLNTEFSSPTVTVTVVNSIIAGNTDGSATSPTPPMPPGHDVHGSSLNLATGGHNWIGVRAGAGDVFLTTGSPNAQNDWVGSIGSPLDPDLEALADNGGPTRTHMPALSPPSPLVDVGVCPGEPTDQRGYFDESSNVRAFDEPTVATHASSDGCDIGAVEAFLPAPSTIFEDGFESGGTGAWSRAGG
jgi:predicted outer membrane repeat protein